MGIRRPGGGDKPDPPELKIATGTWQGGKADIASKMLNARPIPRPVCPEWLKEYDEQAEVYWETLCDMMQEASVPFAVAQLCLENLVVAYANWRVAVRINRANNKTSVTKIVYRDGTESWKPSPMAKELRVQSDHLIRLATDLALTPTARATVLARLVDATHQNAAASPHASASLPTRKRGG